MPVAVRNALAVLAIISSLPSVAYATVYFKIADEWGTIQPAGPRTGTSGSRFWNAQGSSSGANASTAPFRFYTSDLISQFDAEFGAGQWEVTNVNLVFSQSNISFTSAGGLKLYWFENDSLAITSGEDDPGSADPGNFATAGLAASPLRYSSGSNALDTVLDDGTTDANAIFGNFSQIDEFQFTSTGNSGDWPLDVLAPLENGDHVLIDPEDPFNGLGNPSYGIFPPIVNPTRAFRSDTLANFDAYAERVGSDLDIEPIAADLASGTGALSFILVADAATAATYKGNPFGGDYPARIYIEVNELAPAEDLAGDYNDDGVVNAADYALWRDQMGSNDPDAIFNNMNGTPISQDHYNTWYDSFGNSELGSGPAAAVPEPASLALVATSLLAIAFRRAQRGRKAF